MGYEGNERSHAERREEFFSCMKLVTGHQSRRYQVLTTARTWIDRVMDWFILTSVKHSPSLFLSGMEYCMEKIDGSTLDLNSVDWSPQG